MTKEKLLKIFYIDSACVGFWTHSLLSLTDTWTSFVMASLSPSHVYFGRHIWSFEKLFFRIFDKALNHCWNIYFKISRQVCWRARESEKIWTLNIHCGVIIYWTILYFVKFGVISINRMCLEWKENNILNIALYSIFISPLYGACPVDLMFVFPELCTLPNDQWHHFAFSKSIAIQGSWLR